MPRRCFTSGGSSCTSPQSYRAVRTPSRHSELDFLEARDLLLLDGRSRSHSHALSAILGGQRVSTSALRPASQQLPLPPPPTRDQEEEEEEEKTGLPSRLARWRRRRRHWKRALFWLAVAFVVVGCFALAFGAPRKLQPLAPVVLGASLSLFSTFMVVASFLRRRRLRRRPNELLVYVALCEFGLALLTLVHVLALCRDGVCRPMGFRTCSVAVGLELFLLLAGVGWFGAAILHLFVSVSNPFASYKRQLVLYHAAVWGLSLIASIVTPLALFSKHTQTTFHLTNAEICRAVGLVLPLLPADAAGDSTARRSRRLAQWQQLNLAFWGVLVAIVVVVVVAAQLSLVVGWWRSNSGTVIALKARRRLMKRMTIYVHALNATWLVLLVVFFVYRSNANALVYVFTEGATQPEGGGLNALDALFHFVLTAKGFVTGVVWLCVNRPCCTLGLMLCGLHQCSEDDDGPSLGASGASQSASLSGSSSGEIGAPAANQAAYRAATIVSMEAGVIHPPEALVLPPSPALLAFEAHESVRASDMLVLPDRRSLPTMMGPPSTSSCSSSSSYDASTVTSWEASQNNETLQREIIYYTVCGITKAIIRSAERARASTVSAGDAAAVLGDDSAANSAVRDRSGALLETTLLVGAERDSTWANSSFISHVQSVNVVNSPRAYCQPPSPAVFGRSLGETDGEDDEYPSSRLDGSSASHSRPTRPSTVSSSHNNWRQPPQLQHSRSQGSQSPRSTRSGLVASSVMFRSFNQTPGRFSLYPVSQVPFELFEQEIELQSSGSSSMDEHTTGGSTRSTVLAGLRRTATSAFSQRRGVFRGRSGSTGPTVGAAGLDGSSRRSGGRELYPEDPKPKVFVDYAPREFRAIRLAFGLSDEKYLASFRTTAKERVSAGSSGAFMFFSGDNSLLVKSLKEKECRALVDMAPSYARYLTANPHSRLIRFFGCHRVRLYGRNFYFAVMSNVLHSERHTATIAEKYDVKGSWVDRRARRLQRGDRVTCAECDASYLFGGEDVENGAFDSAADAKIGRISVMDERSVPQFPFHVHRPDVVFKDLDLTRSLKLPRLVAAELHAQVVKDCEFLKDMGIMDYSLLIGTHKCHLREPRTGTTGGSRPPATFEDVFDREPRPEELGGGANLAPLGDDEVYFVGIIDILQQWDWEKQLEKAGKVLLGKSARGISAVAPAAYCRRFQARCAQILLGGPAPEALDQDWDVDPNASDSKGGKDRTHSRDLKEVATADCAEDSDGQAQRR
ncbi:hypothetical protein BBJ28_00004264 [Nothophytophthora sp. Chile5]|nr:hypothetical protein BBJ28_00004264 [Nothophytophthora sp. Chile5]